MNSLLLLHGAIGTSSQLQPFQSALKKYFPEVYLFDFPGHGGKEFPAEPFSIKVFAESVLEWMNEKEIKCMDIFGYSMGGYIALYLARHYPERVGKIMTLATKFAWNEETSQKEMRLLNPEKIAEKVPKFAALLEKNHAPNDWKEVLKRTGEMMLALGKNPELKGDDFLKIENKILLTMGERDAMVSVEETENVFRLLKNAEFKIVVDTPHPIEQVEVGKVEKLAEEFFRV
jgi:pimeloyl-ACP methyl ester carboxylesterase